MVMANAPRRYSRGRRYIEPAGLRQITMQPLRDSFAPALIAVGTPNPKSTQMQGCDLS